MEKTKGDKTTIVFDKNKKEPKQKKNTKRGKKREREGKIGGGPNK